MLFAQRQPAFGGVLPDRAEILLTWAPLHGVLYGIPDPSNIPLTQAFVSIAPAAASSRSWTPFGWWYGTAPVVEFFTTATDWGAPVWFPEQRQATCAAGPLPPQVTGLFDVQALVVHSDGGGIVLAYFTNLAQATL